MKPFRSIASACLIAFAAAAAVPPAEYYLRGYLTALPLDEQAGPDAIVIFDGERTRVEHGLSLHLAGTGKQALISGYNYAIPAGHTYPDTVHYDLDALNTKQNGINSAAWLMANHHKSVLLVTSENHVPRSLLELSLHLPPGFPVYVSATEAYKERRSLFDSERNRHLCRLYESWLHGKGISLSFCYEARETIREFGIAQNKRGAPRFRNPA